MFGGYRSYIDRIDGNETAKRDDRKIIACKIEQLKKERNYILWEKTGKSVFCAGFPVFLLDRNPNKPLAMQVDPKPALSPR